jgi:tetratricopeptide (TPR) repeat protein
MSSRHLTKALATGDRADARLVAVVAVCAALLSACASNPLKPDAAAAGAAVAARSDAPTAVAQAAGVPATAIPGGASPAGTASTAAGTGAAPQIPRRAIADFDRAVGMMRSGNATEAELEFKQIAVAYPQLTTPYVNLGILLRKAGQLDQSEQALQSAVERNGGSALAWTELGATQRLRGKFQDAAASYEKAIAADPNYAPAYRNLGVDSDLYLADPERALTAFERYKELTGEEKPVSGWIAELRQRTGKPVVKPAAPPAAAPAEAPAQTPGDAPAEPAAAPAPHPSVPAPKAGG